MDMRSTVVTSGELAVIVRSDTSQEWKQQAL